MTDYINVAQDIEVHVVDLVMAASRLDMLARQFPTITKKHRAEIECVREQINDTLARLERNWDQIRTAAE